MRRFSGTREKPVTGAAARAFPARTSPRRPCPRPGAVRPAGSSAGGPFRTLTALTAGVTVAALAAAFTPAREALAPLSALALRGAAGRSRIVARRTAAGARTPGVRIRPGAVAWPQPPGHGTAAALGGAAAVRSRRPPRRDPQCARKGTQRDN